MYLLLNTFWFVWMLKYTLFWLYLWQLKEYHIGRLVDHFKTSKGKKVLFSLEQIFKLVLVVFLLFTKDIFSFIFSITVLLYFGEVLIFVRVIFKKSFKKPVKTFKTLFLTLVSFSALVLFLIWNSNYPQSDQILWLLIFDIATPVIISAIVLLFQPFFVLARNLKLKKAKAKLEKIRQLSKVKVIAITGSYGKTSTKEFLTTILSKKFKVLSTSAHQNSEVGVANCILNDLKPSHEIFIAEVGAYNKGKVKEVCNILKPKIGIVTGVNGQHMSLFGSMENLLSAEGGGELAEFLIKDGTLIVNGDNKYCLNLYKNFSSNPSTSSGQAKLYSLSNKVIDADIWAENITVHKDFISFIAIDRHREATHFDVKVLGKQNVQNLLGSILVAKQLGMTFGEISEACKNIKQEQAGMTLKQEKHGINIIDSSYSANPDGVFADLDYLSVFTCKKIVAMPCLIELGKSSAEIHEKIGKKIGEICDMAIITSKDKFKEVERGFNSVIPAEAGIQSRIILIEKPEEIYSAITTFCKSGDAVLLEGRVPAGLMKLLNE